MIKSILDNDLYKFTMQQAVCQLYPWAHAEYRFINRGETKFNEWFLERLQEEIECMEGVHLSEGEANYLRSTCSFLTPVYIDFLQSYYYSSKEVDISLDNGNLSVTIRGPWYRTILWEVPLMTLISELYFSEVVGRRNTETEKLTKRNRNKAIALASVGAQLVDFGTRRRYSHQNQRKVISDLLSVSDSPLIGTSNVAFAHEFGIRPIGTHAHEWFMYHGAVNGYLSANKTALDAWAQVYQGNLGIALTDTYTTDVFLQSFDSAKARLFDGVRHDSGDYLIFTDKVVAHYEKLGIDPLTKTIVFSDSLTTEKAIQLHNHCKGKIKCSFGIGTHLTNDVEVKPLNMVIKMTKCRRHPSDPWLGTVKLSDSPGKHTGDPADVNLCLQALAFYKYSPYLFLDSPSRTT